MKQIVFCLILFISSFLSISQTNFIGVNYGYGYLMGDVQSNLYLQVRKPLVSIKYLYFKNKIGLGSELSYYNLTGDDAFSADSIYSNRNLNFNTSIFELGLLVNYTLYQTNFRDIDTNNMLKIIIGTGLSYINFHPKSIDKTSLKNEYTEGVNYSTNIITLPIRTSLQIPISAKINFDCSFLYNISFTDYIDDVSIRGNPNKNDNFFKLTIGLGYVF